MPVESELHANPRPVFPILLRMLYGLSIILVIGFLIDGMSFYRTPAVLRPHHADYRVLQPAGSRGLGFGYAGSIMILLLLLYTWRKRSRRLARVGATAQWLSLHIYLGIFGPLFVTLHTGFRISGLVAVAYWAMVAVALSGVFGRYVHHQIPRNVLGEPKSTAELARELATLERRLTGELGLTMTAPPPVTARRPEGPGGRMLRSLLVREAVVKREATAEARALARERGLSSPERERLEEILCERAVVASRLERLGDLQEAFHHWHVIHKPFSYVMLVFMGIHIAVSMALGYTWAF